MVTPTHRSWPNIGGDILPAHPPPSARATQPRPNDMHKADNEDPNSQEENEADEQEAEEEAEDVGLNMYRAPESGEVAYFVDQTPEKIASELLIVDTAEEEDEDGNQSGSDAGAEGDESKKPKDAAGNPSYWRGSFVPLGEEELQAMKQLPEGEEALEEYFVRRYDQAVAGYTMNGRTFS